MIYPFIQVTLNVVIKETNAMENLIKQLSATVKTLELADKRTVQIISSERERDISRKLKAMEMGLEPLLFSSSMSLLYRKNFRASSTIFYTPNLKRKKKVSTNRRAYKNRLYNPLINR